MWRHLKHTQKRNLVNEGLLFTLLLISLKTYGEEFKRALPEITFSFPQDHFSHPNLRPNVVLFRASLRSKEKIVWGPVHLFPDRAKPGGSDKIKMVDSKPLFIVNFSHEKI
jgi:hypothetical protein